MNFRLGLVSMVAIALLGFGATVMAQQSDPPTVRSHGGGEANSANLDMLAVEQQSSQERVFVIARLGSGETSASLNQRRLQAAKTYLIHMRGLNADKVIFAAGEKVSGEGRVEFYLGGRLTLVSLAPRNRNVELQCCLEPAPRVRRHPTQRH